MEEHQQHEQTADIPQTKPKIQRKHIDFLPLDQQRNLRDKEEIIKTCIVFKEQFKGRLPRGENQAAMRKLKIKSRQTLLNLIERYEQHPLLFPGEPAVNALIQNRGRPPKATLTPEEAKVALGLYLTTDWETVLEPENLEETPVTRQIKMRPRVDFVHNALRQIFPDSTVSQDQLWHFLDKQRRENQVLFVLARYSEKRVWIEFMPKTSNDVEAPNDRWQSDGRTLPIVVCDDDDRSLTFTVTQVIVLDDYSRYVPAWTIIRRKEKTHTKKMRRVGVKGEDVRLVLATAFRTTGLRCSVLYTDHGSEYEAVEPYLKYLTDDNEPPILMVFSKPGHPWGRGKVEVIGSLTDSFLRKLPGFVEDEDDLDCWDRARRHSGLLTFTEFKKQLTAYWNEWNTYAQSSQQSRKEIYENAVQSLLPAPNLIRLAHLGLAEKCKEVSVSDNGLYYLGVYYKPKAQDEASTLRWINAAGRTRKVPLYMLPLVEGENRTEDRLVIACLDGKTWEEVIPLKSKLPSAKKQARNQRSTLNQKKRELSTVREDLQAVLTAKYRDKPKVRALTGDAIIGIINPVGNQTSEEASAEIVLTVGAVDSDTSSPKTPSTSPTNQGDEPSSQPAKASSNKSRRRSVSVITGGASTKSEPESTPPSVSLTSASSSCSTDDDAEVRERLHQLRAERHHKERT